MAEMSEPSKLGEKKMAVAHVEYLGFESRESTRDYRLRVHQGAIILGEVTVAIPNSAFLTKIVRYQDGPALCFHKLQVVITDPTAAMPERIEVSPADLADYCAAQAPRPSTRRAKPLPPIGS